MTNVLILPDINSIDEEWDEIALEKGLVLNLFLSTKIGISYLQTV
jgi:hypothetical protein